MFIDHNKDLKAIIMMFIQKKLIRFALSVNDDKRWETYDSIKAYPYGTNVFKVCESEMLNSKRFILWKVFTK